VATSLETICIPATRELRHPDGFSGNSGKAVFRRVLKGFVVVGSAPVVYYHRDGHLKVWSTASLKITRQMRRREEEGQRVHAKWEGNKKEEVDFD